MVDTTFELLEQLSDADQKKIAAIQTIPSGQRSAKEADFLTARTPYLTNQLILTDTVDNLILIAAGNTVPTGYTGFKTGSLFIDLATKDLYANIGNETSATWADLTTIGSGDIGAGAVGTTQLASLAVTAAKLAANLDLTSVALSKLAIEVGTPVNAVAATVTITSNNTDVADGDTITINGRVYRFKSTMLAINDVHISGVDADTTLGNLKAAINHTGTEGTDYFTGTTINTDVSCGNVTSHAITLTAKIAGIVGNAITITKSSTPLTLSNNTGNHLNSGVDGTVGLANQILKDDTYAYFCLNAGNTIAQANWRRVTLGSAY